MGLAEMKVYIVRCSVYKGPWPVTVWIDKPFHKTPESAQKKIEKLRRLEYRSQYYRVEEVEVVEEE